MRSWSGTRLRSAGITLAALLAIFLLTALLIEFVFDRGQSRAASEFMIIASIVVAIQVYVGNSGLLSFGHVAFYATGAYLAGIAAIPVLKKQTLLPDLPPWLMDLELGLLPAIGLAVVGVAIFAAVMGVPLARMKASVVSMATLALLVITYTVLNLWDGVTRGSRGLINVPDLVNTWDIFAAAAFIVAAALLYSASPWGLRLQAVREDEVAATTLGISVARERFLGWMVSAILVGIGGAVWGLNNMAFGPDRFFFAETFALLAMLVIGGIGSTTGAVLGALVVSLLGEVTRGLERGFSVGSLEVSELPGLTQLATAVLIIVVLIWRPLGLIGGREVGSLFSRRSA